jgi:hypothetical protein
MGILDAEIRELKQAVERLRLENQSLRRWVSRMGCDDEDIDGQRCCLPRRHVGQHEDVDGREWESPTNKAEPKAEVEPFVVSRDFLTRNLECVILGHDDPDQGQFADLLLALRKGRPVVIADTAEPAEAASRRDDEGADLYVWFDEGMKARIVDVNGNGPDEGERLKIARALGLVVRPNTHKLNAISELFEGYDGDRPETIRPHTLRWIRETLREVLKALDDGEG